MTESLRVNREDADAQAARFGPALTALLADTLPAGPKGWNLPGWTSITRPGWKRGGPLALNCEDCDRGLLWADWWHADAVRLKNNALVFCSVHGGPVTHHGNKLQRLVWARQQLDSSVYPPAKSEPRYAVYAYEVLGRGRAAMYVGETTKTVDARYAEHVAGIRAPQVIRGGPGTVGLLRQDLVGELPPPRLSDSRALGSALGPPLSSASRLEGLRRRQAVNTAAQELSHPAGALLESASTFGAT